MKRTQLLLIATLAALLVVAARTATAGGAEATLTIDSDTTNVGDTVEIDITANVPESPGLAAWTVDPIWDDSVIDALSCEAYQRGVCSTNFASNQGRVTGAAENVLVGEILLATYVFECIDSGISQLTLHVEVLTDNTTGEGDLDEEVIDGEITCVDPERPIDTIRIESTSSALNKDIAVDLEAVNMQPPGLGAWTITIEYDNEIVSLVGCEPHQGSACNTTLAENLGRVVGASATGLIGTFDLATLLFQCRELGVSPLSLDLELFGTAGFSSFPIYDLVDGAITCLEPGPTSAATATPSPMILPPTGTGSRDSMPLSPIAALTAFGLIVSAIAIAARRRA